MRIIFLICLFLSITTLSYGQGLTPEERLKLLDDTYYSAQLKEAEQNTVEALNECMDGRSQRAHVICGKTAIYYLNCILTYLHEEGTDVQALSSDCAIASRIEMNLLREGIIQ